MVRGSHWPGVELLDGLDPVERLQHAVRHDQDSATVQLNQVCKIQGRTRPCFMMINNIFFGNQP